MKYVRIAPSILSADFSNLKDQVKKLEEAKVDLIHIDVMDGNFVSEITFGPLIVDTLKRITKIPLDAHLMIKNPESQIDKFVEVGSNMISFHLEACNNLIETIKQIKDKNVKAGIAINPDTLVEKLNNVLDELDFVLIMSVFPGGSGQSFIKDVESKIGLVKSTIEQRGLNLEIEVDGGINKENIKNVAELGADMVVAGNAVFGNVAAGKPNDIIKSVRELREALV
ncbi:MAG: ribulose-phosphate 3-epimerase [Actinobacteria bacterium]|nr:ribulose-phosphate 3-epimerase [Actinomycetota bacterium]